jgi:hypothetical protein
VRKRLATIMFLALVVALIVATGASAVSDYAGNTRTSSYGVSAYIYTPASAPWVGNSGQSSWVSGPGPSYWVQAGWRYYGGYPYARSYYEYNVAGGYRLQEVSNQAWGTSRTYEVSYAGGNMWTAKIAGVTQGSWGYMGAPATVKALSESHYPTVQLNTQFNYVTYRTSSTWYYFNQANWVQDAPYWVSATYLYKYKTQGP